MDRNTISIEDNGSPASESADSAFKIWMSAFFEDQNPSEAQIEAARMVWMSAVLWVVAWKPEVKTEGKTFTERRRIIDIASQKRYRDLTEEVAEFIAKNLPE